MGICTRALFHRVHGLAFALCAYCEKRWWARHLFSVVWPSSQLRDHALNPADPPTFHAPVHQNLGHLAPVRINDVAVSGVHLRRDKRTGRPTSAQYQLLGICGDERGLSTQFISFGRKALRYVLAPQSILWRWYRILHHHRPDLECVWSHLWGSPECDNRQDLKREVPKVAFGTCSREATWVAQVKRRPPSSREEVSARRAILRKGAAGWVMPRVLPQTPQNAITAALHALLVVRSIRATLLQPTEADIDVKHPIYDTLAMVFRGLFCGDIPDRQLFKELKELLTMPHGLLRDHQLTRGQSRCAHTVLDTLLTRIFVRSSVGHDLPTMFRPTWPRHAGIVLPPAFAPCALRCTLRDPPPSDLLWHLNNLVAQWPSNERLGICGAVLLVYVDCTAITCDVTFPLILPFFGRYVLRSLLYCQSDAWVAVVPGRYVNANAAWFECGQYTIKGHETNQWSLRAGTTTMLVYETPSLRQGIDVDTGDVEGWVRANESSAQTAGPTAKEDGSDSASESSSAPSDGFPEPLPAQADVLESRDAPALDVEAEDLRWAEQHFLASVGGEADAFADDTIDEALEGTGTYVKDAMEYLDDNPSNSAGVHVLLSTLAELTAQRGKPAQWVRNFAQSVTSRLPNLPNISEYLEAYLFPSHFPVRDPQTGHFAGNMPLRMYSASTLANGLQGFVNPERHVQEVLNDPHSTRAHDVTWVSYAFSVLLSRLLERGPSVTMVKRGLQAALRDYGSQQEYSERFGDTPLPGLLYDKADADRHVALLCAARKKLGDMTYFGTETCDMSRFPGVAPLWKRIVDQGLDPQYFAVDLQRAWYRSSNLLRRHLMEDPAKPLGNITHVFIHCEWQTDKPNFHHLHWGVWTDDPIHHVNPNIRHAAIQRALGKLFASVPHAFDWLGDPSEIAYWEARAALVQPHKHGDKCKVPVRDPTQVVFQCKAGMPKPLHSDVAFTPIEVKIPDCVRNLLVEEGVAFEDTKTPGVVRLHEDLQGGIWEPPRLKNDGLISQFCPRVFVATNGCHSNWQLVYGSRFLLAYLIKYLSSEEERSVVRLTQQGPQIVKATEQDEHKRKRTTGLRLKRKCHGRTIGVPEMIFYCLRYSAVYCTFSSRHVNTGTPEGRFRVLRMKWRPQQEESPIFGPAPTGGRGCPDDSRCGRHNGQPMFPDREPTIDQRQSYTDRDIERYHPDAVLLYCLRPPETYPLEIRDWAE